MENKFRYARLVPLNAEASAEISGWRYESPYEAYSFRGEADGWLMDSSIEGERAGTVSGPYGGIGDEYKGSNVAP